MIITKYAIPNTIGLDISDFKKDTHGILPINKLLIGINSAGDDENAVKKIDILAPSCDIIICACRTKGITYQHIYKNYNYATGWLQIIINVDEFILTQVVQIAARDARLIDEIQSWLIGLEK